MKSQKTTLPTDHIDPHTRTQKSGLKVQHNNNIKLPKCSAYILSQPNIVLFIHLLLNLLNFGNQHITLTLEKAETHRILNIPDHGTGPPTKLLSNVIWRTAPRHGMMCHPNDNDLKTKIEGKRSARHDYRKYNINDACCHLLADLSHRLSVRHCSL